MSYKITENIDKISLHPIALIESLGFLKSKKNRRKKALKKFEKKYDGDNNIILDMVRQECNGLDKSDKFDTISTGKRKCAIAKVFLTQGYGKFTVNNKNLKEYFDTNSQIYNILNPLKLTNTINEYDIKTHVKGGGLMAQANAISLGISRAILKSNPDYKQILKRANCLRRDDRIKERKKYGQKGARARFQFSKR